MVQQATRVEGLVSVIIGTHNYGKFICEALNGLKEQTYSNLEIIIIDDYSDDDTEEIVKEWRKKNKKCFEDFLYIKLPRNCSASWALNIGFYLSKGEYIVIHDADDISHNTKISRQVKELIEDKSLSGIGTKFKTFIDNMSQPGWTAAWLAYDTETITQNYKKDEVTHCVSFGTLLFKAEVINDIVGVKRLFGEANDILFLTDIVRSGHRIGNMKEILFNVRLHTERQNPKYESVVQKRLSNWTEKKGRVSIVLTVENSSNTILRVLDCISLQSYWDIEIVIVDNNSIDSTEELVNEWYSIYQGLNIFRNIKKLIYFKLPRVIEQPYLYNIGVYLSKGEYIVFHGNNGISVWDKIYRQVKFLENYRNYSVIGTNYNEGLLGVKFGTNIYNSFIYEKTDCININTVMIRSSLFNDMIGLASDKAKRHSFLFFLRLLNKGYLIENLRDVLYYE